MNCYTTITIRTSEPVTPDYLAQRVAEACFSQGALRPDEGVLLPSDPSKEYRDNGPTDLPEAVTAWRRE